MKSILLKIALPLLFVAIGSGGCVNLKNVNEYSTSALKGISKFEEIGYSFKQSCIDNCRDRKISELVLNEEACDCKANEKADSVTMLIYHSLSGYLNGLINLTNNDLTNYKMDALTKSLTEVNFGSVAIGKAEVAAYSEISNILLRAFTDKYRKHKIREYLKAGNEPFKILVQFLDFNLSSNLLGKLNVRKQRFKPYYFDLTKDLMLSAFEKNKAVQEYYQRYDKIEDKGNEIRAYSKALKKIAEGHQNLVGNIDRISKREVKEQLIQSASDIQDIIAEFNKIKK